MIHTIKNFSIFKKDNNGDEKRPSYSLSTKIGEEYVDIGAGWVKDGTKGKFISVKLSDAWVNSQDNKKSRRSYVIVAEEDLKQLENLAYPEDTTAIYNGVDLNKDRPF